MGTTIHQALSGEEAGVAISKLGIKKSNRRPWQLFFLGILAGMYIGFGGHLFIVTLSLEMGKILGAALFSVGLILVVIAGAELFTGNLVMLIGFLSSVVPAKKMLRNWSAVYTGNFVGSILLALMIYHSGLLGNPEEINSLGAKFISVAESKLSIPFFQAFIRGILCNILVILAIIMSVMAADIVSKILCILFPITCFVACGFEHCVANMFLIPLGLMAKGMSLPETMIMFKNILPVTLGNIVGGIMILLLHPNRIRQIRILFARKS